MRASLLLVPLSLIAAPAFAAPAPVQIPSQIADPAMADRLTDMMKAMSKAFLDLPVGQIAAAAEGRQPTVADRQRTVRSETGLTERQLDAQIDGSRVAMRQSMKAMAEALPRIATAMQGAARELEEATANMPRPDYPQR